MDEVHKLTESMSFIPFGDASNRTLAATDPSWIKAQFLNNLIRANDVVSVDSEKSL